mgnify:FL=1
MPTTDTQGTTRILIASGDQSLARQFVRNLQDNFSISSSSNPEHALYSACNSCMDLILIDPKLFPGDLAAKISVITGKSPALRIMVIENRTDRAIDQYALFKAGAHGFCKEDITSALLNRAVQLVCEGEFWVQRKLIAQVIGELSREAGATLRRQETADGSAVVDILTPRELEVAHMVHLGGNNKVIARELDISERTVKAHLSAIFRKLNIENRLHLALYFNQIS